MKDHSIFAFISALTLITAGIIGYHIDCVRAAEASAKDQIPFVEPAGR